MSTETKATTRIRWADAPVSTSSSLAFTGRVGRIDEPQFFIYKPPLGSDEYILTTEVPGLDSRRGRADDPEKLEWLAEHWLEEFVSSLGASFMGTPLPARDDHGFADVTCGLCDTRFGTNCDEDDIECTDCGATRCPHCGGWFGED